MSSPWLEVLHLRYHDGDPDTPNPARPVNSPTRLVPPDRPAARPDLSHESEAHENHS